MSDVPEPIHQVKLLMASFGAPWFLIGGWAVDAWLGHLSRDHADVDIGYFRDREQLLFRHLSGWHMAAHDTPDADHDDEWDGHPLAFPAHIHARRPGWPELDLNANERDGEDWLVNREPRITVRLDDAIRESPWGLPTLAPELALWHKGRPDIRERDHQDFAALLPLLGDGQRVWLAGALRAIEPVHPWLKEL
jgi:hypothetical protein